jgi:hypothetical protein
VERKKGKKEKKRISSRHIEILMMISSAESNGINDDWSGPREQLNGK